MELGISHYIFFALIILIIILLVLKQDIIFVSMVGLFTIGTIYNHSILKGIQTIYKGILVSGNEFWNIIVIISIISGMSEALKDIGADIVMLKPVNYLIKTKDAAFFVLGTTMVLSSLVFWPSPAVALVGSILFPVAVRAGLPPIWGACIMNVFGHGIALSGDFFIQGAPGITAKAAGIETLDLVKKQLPLWASMSIATAFILYLFIKMDTKKNVQKTIIKEKETHVAFNKGVIIIAVLTPLFFLIDVLIMYSLRLKGGDAAALISGTSVIIITLSALYKKEKIFENVSKHIKEGFLFGIKAFTPILIVGAFFFLGNSQTATQILGKESGGFLEELGLFLSQKNIISKPAVVIMFAFISVVAGLGGAGFSALPLIGTLAATFSDMTSIDKAALAGLGQTIAIWVGGGTVIPWGVIPVAAICKVSPVEIVQKNIIPVIGGMTVTILLVLFLY